MFKTYPVGKVFVAMISLEGRQVACGAYRSHTEAFIEARNALKAHLEANGFERDFIDRCDKDSDYLFFVFETELYLPY